MTTSGGNGPTIEFDLPRRIDPKKPFNMDIWVNGATGDKTRIYMDQGTDLVYKPQSFEIRKGTRATVRCEVASKEPRSGLVQVTASSDCCASRSVSINAGFRLSARPTITNGLVAGEQQIMGFELIDERGRPTPLDAPLQMMVIASHAFLQDGSLSARQSTLSKPVDRGGAMTPVFCINTALTWLGMPFNRTADLVVELRDDFGDVLLRQPFQLTVGPRWWAQLLAAMAGSLLWFVLALVTVSQRRSVATVAKSLVLAVASGVTAYVVVSAKLIGISIDTTGALGYVVLGLLVSSSGAETIIRAASSKAGLPAGAGSPPPAAAVTS